MSANHDWRKCEANLEEGSLWECRSCGLSVYESRIGPPTPEYRLFRGGAPVDCETTVISQVQDS